jgi:hypothetical protein
MAATIKKWGVGDNGTQSVELRWQQGVAGEKTKITQFQDVAGALQEFKTYLFMKPGSAFCNVVHSPMKFMAITEATKHLLGRLIGFIGDRMVLRKPTPVLFPSKKTWEWVTETISTEGPDLLDHYTTDASWCRSLWIPETECDRVETTVPRLLHIPLVLFEAIREKGGPLMPHDILVIVLKLIENNYRNQDQATSAEAWKLVIMWCVMAAQADKNGDSIVAFAVKAVTENNNPYFGQWMENHLDGTMGKQPAVHGAMGETGVVTPVQDTAQFAAELGKGVAMGLHVLGPFKLSSLTQGGGADSDSKQGYGEEDITALMGFSHVKKGSELQDIWTYFHTMRSKNIDLCRRQLMARMNRWAHNRHMPIDSSVYLEGTTIKAIMELKFNPG